MRNVSASWREKLLIISGFLLICCGIAIPGCVDWETEIRKNPDIATNPQNHQINTPAMEAIDKAAETLNAAKPVVDITAPATGGIGPLALLIVMNVLGLSKLVITEIEKHRLKNAILDIHNNTPDGAVVLAKTRKGKATLRKATGDTLGIPVSQLDRVQVVE